EAVDGSVAVYLRTGVSSAVRNRQVRVRETVDRLVEAGVLEDAEVVGWPERAREPADTDTEAAAVALYDEFVDAAGVRALEPFFEARPATGADDRIVDLPAICIAHREDGVLSALYPYWSDGDHHSIEDCMQALCNGDPIGNVRKS
ncbi:MAG: hypothetical protein ACI80F_000723, partial [Natronomonas sp.]